MNTTTLQELKDQRAELIKQLRATNDLNEQYQLKKQIDRIEGLFVKIKKY